MNVLVLCDDYWHPAHTPKEGLAPLFDAGLHFDFVEDVTDWSAAQMDEYPVVLFTKSNNISSTDRSEWMTEPMQQSFVDYVRRGGGLFVVHSGTAGYRDTPRLRSLFGGVFIHHPKQCPVLMEPIAGNHLTEGIEPFTLTDEHYHMEFDDRHADLFLMSLSEHGTQPAGWTRMEGDGRVCVLTPGHNVEVWLHPHYQTLLKNCLNWCAQSESIE